MVVDFQLLINGLTYYPAGVLAQLGALPAAVVFGKEIRTAAVYFHHPQGGAKRVFFGNMGRVLSSVKRKNDVEAHRSIFCT